MFDIVIYMNILMQHLEDETSMFTWRIRYIRY